MFDETHILRLLLVINSTKGKPELQSKAFQCTQSLVSTHQHLIVRIIDSPSADNLIASIGDCQTILHDAINERKYTVAISCAKLLYTIAHIALTSRDRNAMDIDVPIILRLHQTVNEVIDALSTGIDNLIKSVRFGSTPKLLYGTYNAKLKELLKMKARYCTLLNEWDFEASFKEAYHTLLLANDEVAAILLPYLTFLLQQCRQVPSWLAESVTDRLKEGMNKSSMFINLVKLLLHTSSTEELTTKVISLLHVYGSWDDTNKMFTSNCWNIYLIGLEAGRRGWFALMQAIVGSLFKKVQSEESAYWLRALGSLAYAETQIPNNIGTITADTVDSVTKHYVMTLEALKALSGLGKETSVQLYFVEMRMEMNVIIQLALSTLNMNTNDKTALTRQSRWMQECADRFRNLAIRFNLSEQPVEVDDKEILHVLATYNTCILACEYAARSFAASNNLFFCVNPTLIPILMDDRVDDDSTSNLRESNLMKICRKFVKTVAEWEKVSDLQGNQRHEQRSQHMKTALEAILRTPFILPKAFFKCSGRMPIPKLKHTC